MNYSCKLQEISGFSGMKRIYAKRVDLLQRGGGNKVPRFDAFFKKHGHLKKVVTLSNPGAHTFFILKNYLTTDPDKPGAESFIFLERSMAANPYSQALSNEYLKDHRIKVYRKSFFKQFFIFLYYKFFKLGAKTVGIGGHIRLRENPYEALFLEAINQLKDLTDNIKEVVHILPIASGNMAEAFLKTIEKHKITRHSLYGLMTGDRATFLFLRMKYFFNHNIRLFRPGIYDYDRYIKKAKFFYKYSNIWLDPVHTIHFTDILNDHFLQNKIVVLWITCPFVRQLYKYK